jgi:hypothetical protein
MLGAFAGAARSARSRLSRSRSSERGGATAGGTGRNARNSSTKYNKKRKLHLDAESTKKARHYTTADRTERTDRTDRTERTEMAKMTQSAKEEREQMVKMTQSAKEERDKQLHMTKQRTVDVELPGGRSNASGQSRDFKEGRQPPTTRAQAPTDDIATTRRAAVGPAYSERNEMNQPVRSDTEDTARKHKVTVSAEESLTRMDAERAVKEAELQARAMEDKANRKEEARMRKEADEKARQEADEGRKRDEKARIEAEERTQREEKARKETEERLKREAEEKARKETDERLKREEKARNETEELLKREAEEKARKETEERTKREAEEKARKETEERTKREEKARKEAWSNISPLVNGVGYILRNTRRAAYGSSGLLLDTYPENPRPYDKQVVRQAVCNWTDVHGQASSNILDVWSTRPIALSDIKELHNKDYDKFKSRDVVGVVLYTKMNDQFVYAGIAFPRIVHEMHFTEIMLHPEIQVDEQDFQATYITATERQVAAFFRKCIPATPQDVAPKAEGPSAATQEGPDIQFLYHMFLDELGDFGGNTIESATDSFRVCLQKAGISGLPQTILDSSNYKLTAQQTQDIKTNTKTKAAGGDAIERFAMGLLHSQTTVPWDEKEKDTDSKEMRVIIQIGYYEENTKKGHACSVLISKQSGENEAIVAIADTGETALRGPYYFQETGGFSREKVSSQRNTFECAVALVACTTYNVARRVAYFAEAVRKIPASKEDLSKARTHIWLACIDRTLDILRGVGGKYPLHHKETKAMHDCAIDLTWEGAIDEKTQSSVNTDRHVAVSSLTLGKINKMWHDNRKDRLIASHTQRGSTCTFSSTLWLLGIAHAIGGSGGSLLLSDRSNDSTKMKAASDALLSSVNEVDKMLKTAAFDYIYSMVGTPSAIEDGRYANLTRLIAIEYAKCPWLNTRALRQKMYESPKNEQAIMPNSSENITTQYTLVTSTRPRDGLSDAATIQNGATLASWIRDKGAYPTEDTYEKKAVHVLAFITAARGFISSVVPDVFTHRHECSCADLLTIMKYAVHIMWMGQSQGSYIQQTLIGILMRVTRYAIALAANDTKGAGAATEDPADYTVLKPVFTTTMPWVASEYLRLQQESEKIKRFLLHPTNIKFLGALRSQPKQNQEGSTAAIVSSTDYTEPLIDQNDSKIKELQDYLEKNIDHWGKPLSDSVIKDTNDRIQVKLQENRTMRNVHLTTEEQRKALQFINGRESLVILNIVTWFTKAAIASVDTSSYSVVPIWTPGGETQTKYVFGLGTGFSVLLPSEARPSPGSVSEHIAYYQKSENKHASMLEKPEDHPYDIGQPVPFMNNVDYLYNRTRDCMRPDATEGDGAKDDKNLEIIVKYTGKANKDKASHDVDALVELEDNAECTYEKRDVFYALRRVLMPLRRTGPSQRDIAQAMEILKRVLSANDKQRESKQAQPADINKEEIELMRAMLMLHTDRETQELIDDCTNYVFADGRKNPDLIYHYVTVAILLEKVEGISAAISGEGASVSATNPDTRWAATNIARGKDKTGTGPSYTYRKRNGSEQYTFVVGIDGSCVASELHRRLIKAGCVFDCWLTKGNTFRIEAEGGLAISVDTSGIVATIGDTTYTVQSNSPWWSETHASVILPVTLGTGARAKNGLLVITGMYTSLAKTEHKYNKHTRAGSTENTYLRARFEERKRRPFFVEFAPSGLLPAESTDTEDLVCVFVAYAYAGSMLGTRLMPSVVARSVYDETPVAFAGIRTTPRSAILRGIVLGASCPLGEYSACALMYQATRGSVLNRLLRNLRCTAEDLHSTLVDRLRSGAIYDDAYYQSPQRSIEDRAEFSYWVEHGELEHAAVADRVTTKLESIGKLKHLPFEDVYKHTDEWVTTFEASTGRFVSKIQREKIGAVTGNRFSVVQMIMGFGKSSVIVPMLVARYISDPSIRVVFVTQPPHLVAPASRAVGALITSHPFVENGQAVFAMSNSDFVDILKAGTRGQEHDTVRSLRCKIVVVLSTADMQCLARDYPALYEKSARDCVVHIADEVDAESDPLRSEVIIELPPLNSHYSSDISANKRGLLDKYRALACDLAFGSGNAEETEKNIKLLDATHDAMPGTRLKTIFNLIAGGHLQHKVNFGFSLDDDKLIAVPFEYAGVPSKKRVFADIEVCYATLAYLYFKEKMRDADRARLRAHLEIKLKSPRDVDAIFKVLDEQDDSLMKRFYLTTLVMNTITTCVREIAVSFFDAFGMATKFAAFSGTMGTTLSLPTYAPNDTRYNLTQEKVSVSLIEDKETNDKVKRLIDKASVINILNESSGTKRANSAIDDIKAHVANLRTKPPLVCLVDGCGEFGAFDSDVDALRVAWPEINLDDFDEAGKRKRAKAEDKLDDYQDVLYYSHRNSRGVDSEMPTGTIGFTFLDVDTRSGLSAAAQAMFRMRELENGDHTVIFVCLSRGTTAIEKGEGPKGLYAKLKQNELTYITSAYALQEKQKQHASRTTNEGKAKFIRDVIYEPVLDAVNPGIAQRQQESVVLVQAVNILQSTNIHFNETERGNAKLCFEKTTDEGQSKYTLLNHEMITSIRESLVKTDIGLSPMICDRNFAGYQHTVPVKRAFAIADRRIVVMSIVEAWVRFRDEKDEGTPYVYYTHDGALIRGNKAKQEEGLLLLGRFLCDDSLSILDEAKLLVHIQSTYKGDRLEALRKVLKCLIIDTRFLRRHVLILKEVIEKDPSSILTELKDNDGLLDRLCEKSPEMKEIFRNVTNRFDWGELKAIRFGRSSTKKPERTMRVFV